MQLSHFYKILLVSRSPLIVLGDSKLLTLTRQVHFSHKSQCNIETRSFSSDLICANNGSCRRHTANSRHSREYVSISKKSFWQRSLVATLPTLFEPISVGIVIQIDFSLVCHEKSLAELYTFAFTQSRTYTIVRQNNLLPTAPRTIIKLAVIATCHQREEAATIP